MPSCTPKPTPFVRPLAISLLTAGGVLTGLAIVTLMVANWGAYGRVSRFALLETLIICLCAGAIWRPAARVPLAFLMWITAGTLFAIIEQSYYPGTEAWQLFAMWSAVTVPLCLGARHDLMWSSWFLVAGAAAYLPLQDSLHSNQWAVSLAPTLAGLAATLLLAIAFRPELRRYTGAGTMSKNLSLLLAVFLCTETTLFGWRYLTGPLFWMGFLLLSLGAAIFSQRRFHDGFALAAIGFAFNVLAAIYLLTRPWIGNNPTFWQYAYWWGVLVAAVAAIAGATICGIVALSRRYAGTGKRV